MICLDFPNNLERDRLKYVLFLSNIDIFHFDLIINQVDDPRLDCAILRPMKTEHDSFLAFYLTEDDEQALKFKETRFDLSPYEVPENEEVSTMFIPHKKCTHADLTLGNNISIHAWL